MAQLWNQGEGSACANALDQAMDLPELDGALLMEFIMEDLTPSDLLDNGDGDRLSHVIRSLEAEIIDDGEAAEAMVDGEGAIGVPSYDSSRLEDMFSDLDEYEGGPFFTRWPEVPFVERHEVDGWYTYMDGHEYEIIDHHQYYYAESSSEQVYIPLWE